MTLAELNALDAETATRELLRCCGSTLWARSMMAARPFASAAAMADVADRIWASLDEGAWREAFAAHPRIGASIESGTGGLGTGGLGNWGAKGSSSPQVPESPSPRVNIHDWAAGEQAGVAGASTDTRRRLAAANRDYEARFGYIFIVCATGKTADDMLAIVERRLHNAPEVELTVAAEEQRKITLLRLQKLLDAEPPLSK